MCRIWNNILIFLDFLIAYLIFVPVLSQHQWLTETYQQRKNRINWQNNFCSTSFLCTFTECTNGWWQTSDNPRIQSFALAVVVVVVGLFRYFFLPLRLDALHLLFVHWFCIVCVVMSCVLGDESDDGTHFTSSIHLYHLRWYYFLLPFLVWRFRCDTSEKLLRFALFCFALLYFTCDVFNFRTIGASTSNAQKATTTQRKNLILFTFDNFWHIVSAKKLYPSNTNPNTLSWPWPQPTTKNIKFVIISILINCLPIFIQFVIAITEPTKWMDKRKRKDERSGFSIRSWQKINNKIN